ncbi:unnamed protein product, partial [Prorocentrum cordatum]
EDFDAAVQQTQCWALRAVSRSLAAAGQAFVDWAQGFWKKPPGAVHRHAEGLMPDAGRIENPCITVAEK